MSYEIDRVHTYAMQLRGGRWTMPDPWTCASDTGPGACLNHTPHTAPRGCVHAASWCPDRHDAAEAMDD